MQYALLEQLNDGEFHSGERLAKHLGVTRAAVWKHLKVLQEQFGLEIHAVSGRGYRIPRRIELLDRQAIEKGLRHRFGALSVETFLSIDSTNRYLLDAATGFNGEPKVVLAEHQTAGKGRRGRDWVSPFGDNLYLSIMYRMDQPIQGLMGLSLAIAVAISEALQSSCHMDVQLKWPNDLVHNGKKLCGVLLELQGGNDGPVVVVAGVGLNISLSDTARDKIDQPCISLTEITDAPVSRNNLAIEICYAVLQALMQFEVAGMSDFKARWEKRDTYKNRPVRLLLGDHVEQGICRGIDEYGALLVETDGELRRYYSGEISLRGHE